MGAVRCQRTQFAIDARLRCLKMNIFIYHISSIIDVSAGLRHLHMAYASSMAEWPRNTEERKPFGGYVGYTLHLHKRSSSGKQ